MVHAISRARRLAHEPDPARCRILASRTGRSEEFDIIPVGLGDRDRTDCQFPWQRQAQVSSLKGAFIAINGLTS
jgi:hypothetical protein